MADPKKLSFNHILDNEDVEWNFDQIRQFSEDLVATKEAEHFQETFTATAVKTVNHNLGKDFPHVTVYNSAGVEVAVVVTNIDTNTVRLNYVGLLTDAVVFVSVGQV